MATGEKRLLHRQRTQGASFDMYLGEAVQTVFADGFHGIALGPSITRLDMYRVKVSEPGPGGAGDPIEDRELFLQLVLPTNAFAEMIRVALENLPLASESLKGAMDSQMTLLQHLGSLRVPR